MENVTYLVTPGGEELAMLPRADLEALVAAVEHQTALAEYRAGRLPGLSVDEALAFVNAASPLAFWRKKRGMTQIDLGRAVGISQGYVSDLESGSRRGDVHLWIRLAKALDLPLETIVDEAR